MRRLNTQTNVRTNECAKSEQNENLYHIAPCVWCAIVYFCCFAVVVSFLVLLSTQVTFYFYASVQGVCHAIYLICPFLFLRRAHSSVFFSYSSAPSTSPFPPITIAMKRMILNKTRVNLIQYSNKIGSENSREDMVCIKFGSCIFIYVLFGSVSFIITIMIKQKKNPNTKTNGSLTRRPEKR